MSGTVLFSKQMIDKYMEVALNECKKRTAPYEVPVGCLIVDNKSKLIVEKTINQNIQDNSCVSHAEILCLEKTFQKLKNWKLNDYSMFATLEPCLMCFGALINARIGNLYIGLPNSKTGFFSKYNLDYKNKVKINVVFNIHAKKIKILLQDFFGELRKNQK